MREGILFTVSLIVSLVSGCSDGGAGSIDDDELPSEPRLGQSSQALSVGTALSSQRRAQAGESVFVPPAESAEVAEHSAEASEQDDDRADQRRYGGFELQQFLTQYNREVDHQGNGRRRQDETSQDLTRRLP